MFPGVRSVFFLCPIVISFRDYIPQPKCRSASCDFSKLTIHEQCALCYDYPFTQRDCCREDNFRVCFNPVHDDPYSHSQCCMNMHYDGREANVTTRMMALLIPPATLTPRVRLPFSSNNATREWKSVSVLENTKNALVLIINRKSIVEAAEEIRQLHS